MTGESGWKLWISNHPRLFSAIVGVVVVGFALGAWAYAGWVSYQMQNDAMLKTVADGAAKEDLRAQQDMAEFAYGLLLWAAFGFAASIAGVVFVAFTITQNRRMIEATREIGENQARAYLYPIQLSAVSDDESLRMVLLVQNAGNTPASHAMIRANFAYTGETTHPEPWKLFTVNSSPTEVLSNSSTELELGASWGALDRWIEGAAGEGRPIERRKVMLFGDICYRDVFGAWFYTTFIAHFDLPQPSSGSFGVRFTAGSGGAFKPMPDTL